MQRIAQFEKVSYEQFKKDFLDTLGGWFLIYIDELPFSFNDPESSAVEQKIQEIYSFLHKAVTQLIMELAGGEKRTIKEFIILEINLLKIL